MKFNLKKPCKTCPFLRGSEDPVRLVRERAKEIIHAVTDSQGATFTCHSTIDYDKDFGEGDSEDRDFISRSGHAHCAGAILFSLKVGKPNQMTRIAGRLGLLKDLDMSADVFESEDEMLKASLPGRRTRRCT